MIYVLGISIFPTDVRCHLKTFPERIYVLILQLKYNKELYPIRVEIIADFRPRRNSIGLICNSNRPFSPKTFLQTLLVKGVEEGGSLLFPRTQIFYCFLERRSVIVSHVLRTVLTLSVVWF